MPALPVPVSKVSRAWKGSKRREEGMGGSVRRGKDPDNLHSQDFSEAGLTCRGHPSRGLLVPPRPQQLVAKSRLSRLQFDHLLRRPQCLLLLAAISQDLSLQGK